MSIYNSPVAKSYYHTNYGWVNANQVGSLTTGDITTIQNILNNSENIIVNQGSTGTSSTSFQSEFIDFNARYIYLHRGNLDESSDGGIVVNVSKNP